MDYWNGPVVTARQTTKTYLDNTSWPQAQSMSSTFIAACEQRASDARSAKLVGAVHSDVPSPFAQLMALVMAQHPRLGAQSPAAKLTADCFQHILMALTPALVVDVGTGLSKVGFPGADAGVTLPRGWYSFLRTTRRLERGY